MYKKTKKITWMLTFWGMDEENERKNWRRASKELNGELERIGRGRWSFEGEGKGRDTGKERVWGGKKCEKYFCLFLLLFKKWVGIAKVVVRIAILVHKIFNTNLGRSSICTSLHYFGGPRHTWYTIHHFFQSSNQSRCKVLLYTLSYYNFSHLHLLCNPLPLLQLPPSPPLEAITGGVDVCFLF